MGIDYKTLGQEVESIGVGGISLDHVERAIVIFSEPKKFLYVYNIDLLISSPTPDIFSLPSLLGRDILNQWRMTYNPRAGSLAFQVLSADYTIPLA